ncbi:MAG: GntR family transcriptional regulator [Terracidiphilus sp.]|jgi:GntR family transcriptional regulator
MAELQQLDRGSVMPLHHQIGQRLLSQIQSGVFEPGQPLPPIQEIAISLGVSNMTVRQAIKSLCDLGVLYSKQGKGTFISKLKLEKDFRQILSFTEEMKSRGSTPGSKVLSFEICKASSEVIEALRLKPDDQVIQLRRIRLGNDVPMGIERSTLPLSLCPDLLTIFDPNTSLYKILAEHYGVRIIVADEVVEVNQASSDEARLLRISDGSPMFSFTRTSYVQSGQPVEFVQSMYRGDRYKIVYRLTRINRELLAPSKSR